MRYIAGAYRKLHNFSPNRNGNYSFSGIAKLLDICLENVITTVNEMVSSGISPFFQ